MRKVLKYGGSSLETIEQIIAVGEYIASLGDETVVVVSAMGDTTDRLTELAKGIGANSIRESDALLSTGEICSAALVAMAVIKAGGKAISLSGEQSGIVTNDNHSEAEIVYIDTTRIENELKQGKTVIIAGFQGVTEKGEVTTLGRGGSDTSAVALAAALNCPCEIYTDVDGVYDKDPMKYKDANKYSHISYDQMVRLAQNGAEVLGLKAAHIAHKHRVSLYIGKSLEGDKAKGTRIGGLNIAVIGASGLVGRTFLKILEERGTDVNKLYLYGLKSVGEEIEFRGGKIKTEKLCEENIGDKMMDYAFFSAGESVSREYAPLFAKLGITVIDNSSAWRMDKDVPLIVPQINGKKLSVAEKIISNPNCSVIQSLIPLNILHKNYTVKAVSFTTFQAVSGSGRSGIEDMERTRKGEKPQFYPYSISDSCIPQIGNVLDNGYTEEEMKMIGETRKILGNNDLSVTASCIRVPIVNGHAVNMRITLEKPFETEDIKRLFESDENIVVCEPYPVTEMSNGTDKVYVGRIRRDISDPASLHLWCTADNLRRGAAVNAVEILELAERSRYEA